MESITLPAPAKLNRFLHIIGQRSDGYHLLQTIFQFIDFSDQLTFTLRKDHEITVNTDVTEIANKNNLVVRAAQLLQQSDAERMGVDIIIDKKIPIGGGLGGGSSDAATTLLALNKLWDLNLSIDQLCEIGLQIGADVPVFVRGKTAWADGVGELLTTMELPETWFTVIVPPVHIATAEIFCDNKLTRDTAICTISPSLVETGHNDCERIVRKRYPEVGKALDWLSKHAQARMTGTGGCIFANFDDMATALDVVEQLPKEFSGFVAKGVNESPVLAQLKRYADEVVS
tara:strand:- start:107328 stop:108188 length:861 start_codon:yes stop_codon:yes gene_type:complete